MVNAKQIEAQSEVVGSDGHHLGKVDRVVGDRIELAEAGAAEPPVVVPISWVSRIDGKTVVLAITADEAKSQGKTK